MGAVNLFMPATSTPVIVIHTASELITDPFELAMIFGMMLALFLLGLIVYAIIWRS